MSTTVPPYTAGLAGATTPPPAHRSRASRPGPSGHEPFGALVELQLASCRRYGAGMAVMFIHLDGLVEIGERHGADAQRSVADAALKRLHSRLRNVDLITRVGVDTFGAALFGVTGETAPRVEARVFDELSAPYRVGDDVVEVTAITGTAVFPQGGHCATELVRKADEARRVKVF